MKIKASLWILFAMVPLLAVSPLAGQGQTLDIKSFVHQLYVHGVPYDEVGRFDSVTVVPVLLEMLSDPKEEEYWPNIVVTLGMLGDERAIDPLIRFLEQDISGRPLTRSEYIAKTSVVMALGYVINKSGNLKALTYLKDGVKPDAWSTRVKWVSPYQAKVDDRNLQLSKMTILGLGLSGNFSAADTLLSLRESGHTEADKRFQSQVKAVVAEALKANEEISKNGLASYYNE